MSEVNTLPISHPTGKYDISVGVDLLHRLRELAGISGPIALISDSDVGPLHALRCGPVAVTITFPAGEVNKSLATANSLYAQLLDAGIDRQGTVVALGGGVVGDMAGFVAATYMRGVDFVQCPTSLLAMVDASIGGKTGVDLAQGKNLVGAFKQPTAVIVDIATLQTLPRRQFADGMAEVIKHGLIGHPDLFATIERDGPQLQAASTKVLQHLVTEAITVKQAVVIDDPFEHGRRACLNLGHTFGHAIEQVSGYAVSHGQGVAMGLVAAANVSARLGFCERSLQSRIEAVLAQVGLASRIPADLSVPALYEAMFSDKKKANNKLRFILMRDVGDVFIASDVAEREVQAALTAVQAR